MHFSSFLLKNLLRRPARSLLTIVGLAVAVGAVVSLVGVATGFEDSFMQVYTTRGVDLVVQRGGGKDNINNGLPESLLERISKLDGVEQVVGGLLDMVNFEKEGITGKLLNGWDPKCSLFDRLTVVEGRRLHDGDDHKIMIGRVLAANLDKKVGAKVEIYGSEDFEIVGIYESPIVFENGGAVVTLAELQRLTNRDADPANEREAEVTGFTVSAKHPVTAAELDDLAKRIEAIEPSWNLEATPALDFVRNVNQLRVVRAVAWITSAIAVLIGAIGMLNTMIMSVFERAKEIGTLRAIGWRKTRIMRMVIGESLMLSIGGAIVGSLCAMVLVKFLTKLPIAAGFVQGDIAPPVIAQGFLVAIVVGVAGAIYPAVWSANLLPTEALRRK